MRADSAVSTVTDQMFPLRLGGGDAFSHVASFLKSARFDEETLCLSVVDDGVGGADPSGGSGLIGLKDRVEALGGELRFQSPAGHGTLIRAELPLH